MLVIDTLIRRAKHILRDAGITSYAIDTTVLACYAFNTTRERLLLDSNTSVTDNQASIFNVYIDRRAAYEPIAYIIGTKDFRRLTLKVTADTLIPRPDSECLLEAAEYLYAQHKYETLQILDICTGSGCLLLSALDYFPHAKGVGTDISEGALRVAYANAHTLHLHTRASFIKAHWTQGLTGIYDMIFCNPPYIADEDRHTLSRDIMDYEPDSALFAGSEGMDAYAAVIPSVSALLASNGYAFFECGHEQTDMLSTLGKTYGLLTERILYDLSNSPRGVVFYKAAL